MFYAAFTIYLVEGSIFKGYVQAESVADATIIANSVWPAPGTNGIAGYRFEESHYTLAQAPKIFDVLHRDADGKPAVMDRTPDKHISFYNYHGPVFRDAAGYEYHYAGKTEHHDYCYDLAEGE